MTDEIWRQIHSNSEDIAKLIDLVYTLTSDIRALTNSVERLEYDVSKLTKEVDEHHDKFKLMEGSKLIQTGIYQFFMRHGVTLFTAISVIAVIMYEFKKHSL